MGNRIWCHWRDDGDAPSLKLSNGYTSVLLEVLLLSGSDLAETGWEQQLVTWLAEHDQDIYGSGAVGFDLDEIGWERVHFLAQQAFLFNMVDLALTHHRWKALDYTPGAAIEDVLHEFRALVEQYQRDFIEADGAWQWRNEPEGLALCLKHRVYVHHYGCHLCNSGPYF